MKVKVKEEKNGTCAKTGNVRFYIDDLFLNYSYLTIYVFPKGYTHNYSEIRG